MLQRQVFLLVLGAGAPRHALPLGAWDTQHVGCISNNRFSVPYGSPNYTKTELVYDASLIHPTLADGVKIECPLKDYGTKNNTNNVMELGSNQSEFEKGEKIGEGGFGTVYDVADQPDLVMKEATASGGKANAQLKKEADNLELLTEKGYPTVFKEFKEWTDADGITRQAIIMEKVDGVLSKEILQTGKFVGITPSPSSLNLVNKKTLQELRQFRDKAASDNLVIDDLQFMVDKSGSIHLIDPAQVKDLSGLKPKQKKPKIQEYEKRINRIITGFEKILTKR